MREQWKVKLENLVNNLNKKIEVEVENLLRYNDINYEMGRVQCETSLINLINTKNELNEILDSSYDINYNDKINSNESYEDIIENEIIFIVKIPHDNAYKAIHDEKELIKYAEGLSQEKDLDIMEAVDILETEYNINIFIKYISDTVDFYDEDDYL